MPKSEKLSKLKSINILLVHVYSIEGPKAEMAHF